MSDPVVYTPPVGKPHAIICDIDGTLAHMTGRSPYDETRVLEDTLDEVVCGIMNVYNPHRKIILLSGRHDTCRKDTERWLLENNVYYDELFMRRGDDDRKDNIIKKELFEEHLRDDYQIDFVLDDRDRVVNMWRNELGLKCLQVAEGDF